jgi:hypothetical protein
VTKEKILELEARRFKAMCDADAKALDEVFHRDLKYTHSSGALDSKASYSKGVLDGLWDYQVITPREQSVTIVGNAATIHCKLRIDVIVGGEKRTVHSVAMSVWAEDGGRWQCIAVHSTPQAG